MESIKPMKMVKLFVLGRPGTGKSTAARHIAQIAREHGWHAEHIDDYSILYWMYLNDRLGRFCPASTNLDGFRVVDVSVFDEALTIMLHGVDLALTRTSNQMNLVIIEFARSTYKTSLGQFSQDFLEESYFLLLYSDIDTCMARIEHRAQHPVYEGDHYTSRKAMEDFHFIDVIPATRAMLRTVYRLDNSHIRVIHNVSTEEVFLNEVHRFVERVILRESST
jgi:hypothetical protein